MMLRATLYNIYARYCYESFANKIYFETDGT